MNVIALRTLRTFWERHPNAQEPLKTWMRIIRKNTFRSFNDVRAVYASADLVESKEGEPLIIFNVGGNNYRVIVSMDYMRSRTYIRHIFTHDEYNRWNKQRRPG